LKRKADNTNESSAESHVGARHAVPLQNDLPEGWRFVSLAQIAEINPKIDKSRLSDSTVVSFVPMQAVGAGDGRIDTSITKHFVDVKKGYTPFQSNDVLFAKITPCMENGKIAVVPPLHNNLGFGSTEFHVIRPKDRIDSRYIYYYVSRIDYRKEAASKMTGAVGQKRVSTDFIKASIIPIAPLDQQKRIVAEIEKQFSRLDEAVAALKRIQANLKRYKASVLKAAVEGKLTEEWRSRRGVLQYASTKDETGADLLKRILVERRKKWEEDYVNKYVAALGHAPKDDAWKKKYKEPAAPDTSNLPELPKGWVWATVGQLADVRLGKMLDRQKHRSGKELPYIRNINVRWRSVDTSDLQTMFFKDSELGRYCLQAGDVLICEGGEPGRAAVWDGRISSMMYQKAIHRVRFPMGYKHNLLVFLLEHLAKSGRLARWFTGSTIKHFTGESLIQLPIPLPPEGEQQSIVSEVERLLSVAEEFDSWVGINLKRAERLRQSILKKAFWERYEK